MTKCILIDEDEDTNLRVIGEILEFILNQTNLLVAMGRQEAIRMAHKCKPDIILINSIRECGTYLQARKNVRPEKVNPWALIDRPGRVA
jgi:CheY-like chemotaxis protein